MSEQQELQPQTEQSQPELQPQSPLLEKKPKKRHRQFFLIIGAILLVVVLAGAAYLAGTLMNWTGTGQNGLPQIIPAPELPSVQADVQGIFVSRSGNSFSIGTGTIDFSMQGTPQASHDGPAYEVVLTKDTVLYKDTTPIDPGNPGPIQQTVAPGTLDDLTTTTTISVWGKKTSDRYVADVIFYQQALIKVNGGVERLK